MNKKVQPFDAANFKPKKVDKGSLIFRGNMKELLPPYEAIPNEFKDWNNQNKWSKFISTWFFKGISNLEFKAKEGIDGNEALKHVQSIMCSWEPKHEHKEAGCAYLMSLWFDDVTYNEKK